jgi:hypothetical protein
LIPTSSDIVVLLEMSCCGEPANNSKEPSNRPTQHNPQSVTRQPGPHPGPQFQNQPASFQQPNITAPAPTHQFNGFAQNSLQQQPWEPKPSPGPQFNPYQPSSSPPLSTPSPGGWNGSQNTYNGTNGSYSTTGNQPLISPSPAQLRSSSVSPGLTSPPPIRPPSRDQQSYAPPSDEGKMSVSIDFGPFPFHWSTLSSFSYFIAGTTFSGVVSNIRSQWILST